MNAINGLSPLLIAAGILLAGNGLQGTLIALRADVEGFGAAFIGLMGTAYFIGFLLGSIQIPRVVARVGHIRVFAALAAIAASAVLLHLLLLNAPTWVVLRGVTGYCFAGLILVIESWLNSAADNQDRGRVLSVYRTIDLGAVAGSQFLLPVIGIEDFTLFAMIAVFFCFALVPVAIARSDNPTRPAPYHFRISTIWKISQMACIGCFALGLTNSAFRMVGPLYTQGLGFDLGQLAIFMSAAIVGGAVLALPLGWLSDRFDRRWVLIGATTGAAAAGFWLTLQSGDSAMRVYIGALLFGAFALPLYSLSAAHANDHARPEQSVEVAAGIIFFYGLGASVGPFVASLVIDQFGAPAFFTYTSVVHVALLLFTVYRITQRAAVPRWARKPFVGLLRTSPAYSRMVRARQKELRRQAKARKAAQ